MTVLNLKDLENDLRLAMGDRAEEKLKRARNALDNVQIIADHYAGSVQESLALQEINEIVKLALLQTV